MQVTTPRTSDWTNWGWQAPQLPGLVQKPQPGVQGTQAVSGPESTKWFSQAAQVTSFVQLMQPPMHGRQSAPSMYPRIEQRHFVSSSGSSSHGYLHVRQAVGVQEVQARSMRAQESHLALAVPL